ncbi:thioredoxin C-1 [Liberibacter crescens BT-1]|uniref:Thioredoxin n=1 Tax=Liberibacter crescens (strain BT-1) TaxID=1215343 RepID=L0EWL9_LIBCB|nr:thioredoxin [Liberibacter crescens]AGA65357.1 thioredoxin C-1 [Liberibacter crescens BT-1]AMC12295.1 thioredoxin [Liberibacter crescens]
MNILSVDSQDFNSHVLESKKPVVVDFWADWCGPCKAIAPILQEIAKDLADKVTVIKINIDNNNNLATQYGIRSIPTLAFFKEGNIVDVKVGNDTKDNISNWILSLI